MPALSLQQLATRACIRNVKAITDIGGLPYSLAKPFLLKVDNPDQLVSQSTARCSLLPVR